MIELSDYKGKQYADAKKIYDLLGIVKPFSQWISTNIKRAMLSESDFITSKSKSTGGRPFTNYLLNKESALSFIMLSGGKNAQSVRNEIIKAFQQKQTGILLDVDQVSALTDVVKAMTLVSVQKKHEDKHYEFLNRPKNWYNYRAELLGYSKNSLIEAMKLVNKKYKNQKQALIKLDPAEIIRTGVVDLLIALGRNREYALNVAEFAKVIAEKNGYHLEIWNDMKSNPLGINEKEISNRKKLIK